MFARQVVAVYSLCVRTGKWMLIVLLVARAAVAQEVPGDVVVLEGWQVPKLLGTRINQVAALATREGTLTAVRIQIDQRYRMNDATWRYSFESGDDPHPAEASGLGANDLLLLSAPEGGERLRPTPPDSTEVEVTDPDAGASRWFYLQRGPVVALAPLTRHETAADRIIGQDYAISFSPNGAAAISSLVLGDPLERMNILDRSKARLGLDLALGIGHISRSEDDVRVRTTGIHAGPLRIIRESEVRGRMLLGLYSPPVRDNFIFYPHGFVLPTTIRLTSTARMLVRNVALRISMDLTDAARGMMFQSAPDIPAPIVIDGRSGEHEGTQPIQWYLLRRGDVGLLGWLQARDDVAREVTLYYRDDQARADPPEDTPGELGDHGFIFRHAGPLPAGEIRLSSYARVLHGTELDSPALQLRAANRRPTVRVH